MGSFSGITALEAQGWSVWKCRGEDRVKRRRGFGMAKQRFCGRGSGYTKGASIETRSLNGKVWWFPFTGCGGMLMHR